MKKDEISRPNYSYETLKSSDLESVRSAIRSGCYEGQTASLGNGYLQANLVIIPEKYSLDFMRYCQRNPKPCPLIAVSDTGNPMMFTLGSDIDIRTDLPAYNIDKNGLVNTIHDISDVWCNDFVAFALGCSFTFEAALQKAGISLWHINNNKTVPMFQTNIQTVPAGIFSGDMVVSMRAIPKNRLEQVTEISKRFPLAHGAPIHIGDPSAIGITDLKKPNWGDSYTLHDDQIPVFWACGVTSQVVINRANLPFSITHKPGHMLITDLSEDVEIPII